MISWSPSTGRTPWTQYLGNSGWLGQWISRSVKHCTNNLRTDTDLSEQLSTITYNTNHYSTQTINFIIIVLLLKWFPFLKSLWHINCFSTYKLKYYLPHPKTNKRYYQHTPWSGTLIEPAGWSSAVTSLTFLSEEFYEINYIFKSSIIFILITCSKNLILHSYLFHVHHLRLAAIWVCIYSN